MVVTKQKPFNGCDAAYRGILGTSAWCLCVGAGISVGLVPTWNELTRRVLNSALGTQLDETQFDFVIKQTKWSLDALLQAASNDLLAEGASSDEYNRLLEEALYADLLAVAKSAGVEEALVEALSNPRSLKAKALHRLYQFFQARYATSTVVQLSREVAHANQNDKGPRAVINFNADTLFHTLLDMFLINEFREQTGSTDHPQASFVKVLRGIQPPNRYAVPIFHCHGAVSPIARKSKGQRRDSREHLVFREQEYLDLAGNAYTWAQSLFLFHAQNSPMVIVGHSLADPNIRKWLAWSHAIWLEEFSALVGSAEVTPRHIWITKSPEDRDIRKIQEISLSHLGVRVCRIDDWQDIAPTLRNLLAL
jgi:hypothetical protein